jgi:lysophospholipase L1-like esterase
MNKTLLSLSFVVALGFSARAQAPAAAPPEFKQIVPKMDLKDGDTVVFLGDSITHQCLYTQYIEDFCYTRYPRTRIHFHNSGIGGDRASDALRRFDEDVAAYKPRYVTILLGMNDGGYTSFNGPIFETYEKGMTTLLDRVAEIGAKSIVMTPTMHDARASRMGKRPAEPRDTYYNGVLAYFGAWLREQAGVRGLGFVDMYSPLNNLTLEARKTNANFTLIADAVHPGAAGQVVMAAAILDHALLGRQVSRIAIHQDAQGKWVSNAGKGKLSDLRVEGDKVSFSFQAEALPWVLPPEAAEGYKLTAAGHRYSNESIQVGNLKPGRYELRIDGQAVGIYTDNQLGFRVELETNEKTPQYQQALKVALLNKDRNEKAVRPLRNLWLQVKVKRNALPKEGQPDPDGKKAAFDTWLAGEFKSGIEKMKTLANEYEDQIYAANKVPARKYELALVK